jgi:DNA-binding NarL/FixJ family response regulator
MAGLRYLIVDDSPTVRLTIRQALAHEKVPADLIAEAGSAQEAVETFDRSPADVVFLDVNLQGGPAPAPTKGQILPILNPPPPRPDGGNDVARHMTAKKPGLMVIVCTGNPPDDPRVRELIQAGAFQLLQKPVRMAQIREVLRQVREERAGAGSDT